jgi:tRNA pseudouridine55 synthase
LPKRYLATFLLGRTSTTEDIEGEITELIDPPQPALEAVHTAAAGMIGETLQRPPAFSALKVQGKRAYALARQGHEVALAPRPITIHCIEVVDYAYPQLTLEVECGSGTYIRSLGRDLAEQLGTGAVMSALQRTSIGNFRIDDAIDPLGLGEATIEQRLIPAARAVAHLPAVELTSQQVTKLRYGQPVSGIECTDDGPIAAVDSTGRLTAILRGTDLNSFRSERFFSDTNRKRD